MGRYGLNFHYTKIFFFFVSMCIINYGCKVIDPEEKIPTYIYISDIQVNSNPSTEGTTFDHITDAWVYIDGTLIGTYELPAKIPVIPSTNNYSLEIFPGIKNSGFVAQRFIYPYLNSFEESRTYNPNKVDTITPIVTYKSISQIWIEDFEDPGIKFSSPTDSDTSMTITNSPSEVREGGGSGKISFSSGDVYFDSRTNDPQFDNLPKGGIPVYMELEYNINYPITVGLLHGNGSLSTLIKDPYLTLNSTNGNWNKIYIDFTEVVSTKTAATKHQFYFQVNRDTTFTNPILLLDNIKVIYQ